MKLLPYFPFILSAITVLVAALADGETTHLSTHRVMEHTNAPRIKGITHVRKAHSDENHEVIIAVKHRNLDWLAKKLDEVSYPDSPSYGQHMKKDEIAAMVASPESTKTVRAYLKGLGFDVTRETRHGEYLFVTGKIHQFETLFATEFHEYSMINTVSGQRESIIRAEHYSLPLELVEHVTTVFQTVQFPPPIMSRGKPKAVGFSARKGNLRAGDATPDSDLSGYVYPQLINEYYCVPSNTGNSLTTQAVYEALNQTMSPQDLSDFQAYFFLPQQAIAGDYNGHVDSLTCDENPGDCDEANLDVQYMMGIAQAVPTYYYYWNGSDPFISWIIAVADMSNPQDVYSISYSSYEAGLSASELDEWNTQAQILGLAGTTILSASGDDGVAGFLARDYPDGYEFCGYWPQFPASSPYTLAVGGTQGPEAGQPEIVCSSSTGGLITSGGGFSDYYLTPSYQQSVVNAYLKSINSNNNNAPVSGYNTTGRGYPDVSLLAYNYIVFIGNVGYVVSGTSASTPVMGAFISLVNSYLQSNGQSNMGWANPAIYQKAANYIFDITSGENNCAAQNEPETVCCSEGFSAVPGWDPTTGLGSVAFYDFVTTFVPNYPYTATSQCPSADSSSSDSSSSSTSTAVIVMAVVIPVVAVLLCLAFGWYFYMQRTKDASLLNVSSSANPMQEKLT